MNSASMVELLTCWFVFCRFVLVLCYPSYQYMAAVLGLNQWPEYHTS